MSSALGLDRSFVGSASSLLNTPTIEQTIKECAGIATAIFGVLEIHDYFSEKNASTTWMGGSARFSLILSAATTPSAVKAFSVVVRRLVTHEFLVSTFGPNTIFVINPWHPRHVVSFFAVTSALPTVVTEVFKLAHGGFNKLRGYIERTDEPIDDLNVEKAAALEQKSKKQNKFLNAERVKLMVIFNFVTSRPVLHLGNQLARSILNRG